MKEFDEKNGHFGMHCEGRDIPMQVPLPPEHPVLGKLVSFDANVPDQALYEKGILQLVARGQNGVL